MSSARSGVLGLPSFRALCLSLGILLGLACPAAAGVQHAFAVFGTPKYAAGFEHFEYVNPDAPKGGDLRLFQLGSFDTLNPFAATGSLPSARGAGPHPIDLVGLTFDRLLVRSADEPATGYGLLAESLETAADGRWVVFNLRPQARFHNGSAITADDVLFSFETWKTYGPAVVQAPLQDVVRVEKLADRKVRFVFSPHADKAMPLIVGDLPILSKAFWQGRDITAPLSQAPLGSGPYAISLTEIGKQVALTRVADYWAKDLPAAKGLFNFEHIRTTFFPDAAAAFAAFKAGAYDIRYEYESKRWATAYGFPAVAQGQIIRQSLATHRIEPMRGFVFNLRRPLWQDARVRRALTLAFDFEGLNKALFFGQYTRSASYFANSDWAAAGPPSPAEQALLEPFRGQLADAALSGAYPLPVNDTPEERRRNLREAVDLLDDAGLSLKKGRRIDPRTGQPVAFEILVDNPSWRPICHPFIETLRILGIKATLKAVDRADYAKRLEHYDFDLISAHWPPIAWLGTDFSSFWSSQAADQPGGLNWPGIKNPAVDAIIEQLATASDRQAVIDRARALDRLLLWGDYVIPQWHMAVDHLAFWNRFVLPVVTPESGPQLMAWWIDSTKPSLLPPATANRKKHR
ncbi:extracellular solute-binding protein [Telmatospirillum sp.]|uniref:extracellular solute-binding protein n=1 Tax=Telmatospirillum sp. TaxID=2079197 RepID=UPI002849DF72|nr:extracellular solute-binding protein [Telmatospirillum sp.]MDR3439181.1 extracellular solute-binding protein [Telmatospirillum sp.]